MHDTSPPRYGSFGLVLPDKNSFVYANDDEREYWHSFVNKQKERESARRNLEYLVNNGYVVSGRYVDGRLDFSFQGGPPSRQEEDPPKSKRFSFNRGPLSIFGGAKSTRFDVAVSEPQKPPNGGFYDGYFPAGKNPYNP